MVSNFQNTSEESLFIRAGPVVGLLLVAVGTGGIKPCMAVFGGDQFEAGQVGLNNF